GHEEASGVKYVPKKLFEEWIEKDPIKNYERFLSEENILSNEEIAEIKAHNKQRIEEAIKNSPLGENFQKSPLLSAADMTKNELKDVYAPLFSPTSGNNRVKSADRDPEIRFLDAIKEGLH